MTYQHEVTVWLVHTDQSEAVTRRLAGHLDARESRRAASMADPVRRARYIVAHGAMREIVAARLGIAPGEPRWSVGRNGKPELANPGDAELCVNLSTGGAAALVAVTRQREVGVDIEQLAPARVAGRLAARYFPTAQARYVAGGSDPDAVSARFTTLWSRKEACVKARGGRLAQGMALEVGAAEADASIHLSFPVESADGCIRVHDLPAPPGHRAAVALVGTAPFAVHHRVWASQKEAESCV